MVLRIRILEKKCRLNPANRQFNQGSNSNQGNWSNRTNNNEGHSRNQNQSRSNNQGCLSTHTGNAYFIGNNSQESDTTFENRNMHQYGGLLAQPLSVDDIQPRSSTASQRTGTGPRNQFN